MRLTIELVPATSWFSNLRSMLCKEQWDYIRKECYKKAGYKCEICGGRGDKWPVECHEIWDYDDTNRLQKLTGLVALCPKCHEVKHFGLAEMRGRGKEALYHLCSVNEWGLPIGEQYVNDAFATWLKRSGHKYTVDISWLSSVGIDHESISSNGRDPFEDF